jgi:hypothetical protein
MNKVRYKVKPSPIRHTNSTAAGLEDALAVANDIIEELLRSQAYVRSRTEKLTTILKETREGPYAYDPDKPAGMRIIVTKR